MIDDKDRNAIIARLIVAHRCALFSYVFACVRNHADAEEVLQEVSIAVMSSFDKLNDESEFLPWAREIARRQVLSFFRRSKRSMVYDSGLVDVLATAARDARCEDVGHRRRQALQECVDVLPDTSRHILVMRYSGMTSEVEDIAKQIGRTMSATYGLLKRIRLNLRECVERKLAQGAIRE